jgi:transposase
MAQTVCVIVSAADRRQLDAITADRNRQRKHGERARVVLASMDGGPVQRIAGQLGISRPMVWRWQQRFAEEGTDGLLRDRTRKPGKAPLAAETVAAVVALTCSDPPHQATHWTGRAMAKASGISLRSVQRIWQAHQLQPHRVRTFKRSRDPQFAAKMTDVVGLYVDPPMHAVVLSIDEKSQIQALDRTQPALPIPLASPMEPWAASPGLPLKPGRCGTMTHDYVRHGTTTLFAALNVLDGTVIGRCMQRHRHEEFIRFLNAVEREVPAGKLIEAVVDNYATHKHPKVRAWLERHPRWRFHSRPPPDRGSTRSRRSSPRSPASAFDEAASIRSSTCRRPSIAISPSTTPSQSPSSGPLPPRPFKPSSPNSCTSRMSQSTRDYRVSAR